MAADKYLLEDGTGGYQLEDGSGNLLVENPAVDPSAVPTWLPIAPDQPGRAALRAVALRLPAQSKPPDQFITSVAFDAHADRLTRATNLPAPNGFSVSMFVRLRADKNQDVGFFSLENSDSSNYISLQTFSDGTTFSIFTGQVIELQVGNMTVGRWYFIALAQSLVDLSGFLGDVNLPGALTQVSTTPETNLVPAKFFVGGMEAFSTKFPDCDIAGVKIWDRVLTLADMELERRKISPVNNLSVNSAFAVASPATKLVDSSGLGRDLVASDVGPWQQDEGPFLVVDTWNPALGHPWQMQSAPQPRVERRPHLDSAQAFVRVPTVAAPTFFQGVYADAVARAQGVTPAGYVAPLVAPATSTTFFQGSYPDAIQRALALVRSELVSPPAFQTLPAPSVASWTPSYPPSALARAREAPSYAVAPLMPIVSASSWSPVLAQPDRTSRAQQAATTFAPPAFQTLPAPALSWSPSLEVPARQARQVAQTQTVSPVSPVAASAVTPLSWAPQLGLQLRASPQGQPSSTVAPVFTAPVPSVSSWAPTFPSQLSRAPTAQMLALAFVRLPPPPPPAPAIVPSVTTFPLFSPNLAALVASSGYVQPLDGGAGFSVLPYSFGDGERPSHAGEGDSPYLEDVQLITNGGDVS